MAADHRLIDSEGNKIPFSCSNRRYRTNIDKGFAHQGTPTGGSVFPVSLVNHNGYSLWLEHVKEIESGDDVYWLMWYDPSGTPTIPLSGILDREELAEMAKRFVAFLP